MVRNNDIVVRINVVFLLVAGVLLGLVGRLYHVQINRHDELYDKARAKYTAVTSSKGERGKIFDYDGNLLVGNVPCADLDADPQIVGGPTDCKNVAKYFSDELDVPFSTLYRRLTRKNRMITGSDGETSVVKNRYAPIASRVDYELATQLQDDVQRLGFRGVNFRYKTKRYYPKNELLANILGFTNIDCDRVIAVVGIEKFFNEKFRPTSARSRYERGRDGMPLSYGKRDVNEVKDGLNVYLTIREQMQAILEEELDKLVAKWRPRAAYAILADPWTGDLWAVAQRPSYNPNDRSSMRPAAWRNRVTEDVFEPGSTMKPIAVSGALDYGVVGANTRFDCERGRWYYGGKILRDAHPMEILTVTEIIEKSSNIGTAKIALRLGENRLYQTLRRFGFGRKTGVPLSPETSGIFRHVTKWDTLSITRFPIGQGIAVSPLQLVRAYCALANGGRLLELRLVDRIEDPKTGVTVKIPAASPVRVFNRSDTHEKIVSMMKKVTGPEGTAKKAAIEGYEVAGKTGTSQKWINGAYSHSKFFATFIGFVPADKPAFVLLVTADEPKDNHYGGTVAAPTFKSVAAKVLRVLNIPPDLQLAEAGRY